MSYKIKMNRKKQVHVWSKHAKNTNIKINDYAISTKIHVPVVY